jgi:hypothetical protein
LTAPTQSKLAQLRAAWSAGDKRKALSIAAKFHNLGEQRDAILSGWGAVQNPRMYAQMGRDCEALEALAYAALAERYDLD